MFSDEMVVFGVLVLMALFMGAFVFVGWYSLRKPKIARSPYTGLPVRKAVELPYTTRKMIAYYLDNYHQYDNRPFNMGKACFCRETGRVFPNTVDWKGKVTLDWSFLQKRYEGTWISWGSLSSELKEQIRNRHEDLEGFQTEYSSQEPSPRMVEARYSYRKPGPLYVDVDSGVLIGWKLVPDTELEVLIVQKPIR